MPSSLRAAVSEAAFTFVIGKGGVGKTTTAGALALGLAADDQPTLLLSTDPAHSLADLFELAGAMATEVCGAPLSIEEFDARSWAAEWTRRQAGAITALIEAGTYLDAHDADTFLGLSVPGIDEVMAALRLVELASPPQRVIVDTAPTGHTLRLLEAALVIRSWAAALDAMAAKAGAVGTALAGRGFEPRGVAVVRRLEDDARRFERDVLAAACAVVVTRAEPGVLEETSRLIDAVRARGLRPAAIVQVGGGWTGARPFAADVPWFTTGLDPGLSGCDGLRRWRATTTSAGVATATGALSGARAHLKARARATREPAGPWLDDLPLELLLFAGKGGVGKSTCAAAVAIRLARNRPVELISTDPAGSLGDVLGVAVGATRTRVGERLGVRQIDAAHALAAWRNDYEREIGELFDQLVLGGEARLDRQVAETLWNLAPPGIDEIAALMALLDGIDADATVVIDASPTGHFLRLVELPGSALDWTHALLRVLLKYRAAGALDAVASRVLALAQQLKTLRLRLTDPAVAGAFVVTLPQPLVRAETERLVRGLSAVGVAVTAIVANRNTAADALPAGTTGTRAPVLVAPAVAEPLVGAARLEAFLDQWELQR